MFISVLDIFKVGIGPSSSHTLGPLVAAGQFVQQILNLGTRLNVGSQLRLRCTLKGSLAYTGKGHGSDKAITLGLHGYSAKELSKHECESLIKQLLATKAFTLKNNLNINFSPEQDIVFDKGPALPEHPNAMIFDLMDENENNLLSETYFSIGGGFVQTREEIKELVAPLKMQAVENCAYPFATANAMLEMSGKSGLSIAQMKYKNELTFNSEQALTQGLKEIWMAMETCVQNGLGVSGELPGGIHLKRRAQSIYKQLVDGDSDITVNDWLSAYAMAVNEENAAGHMVVTAPTNGAAGVIPSVLYYWVRHRGGSVSQINEFLLTASAIGGIIKHQSSISGAEVGCQGEIGSAAAMAAAGLCAIKGGTSYQVENAAEIALEHHLGMTCDPVKGLVQVPCIERNAFGAIKAHAAAMLALRGSGSHFMPLDNCIAAMKQTGMEMSEKYKETSLGGLAVNFTEC